MAESISAILAAAAFGMALSNPDPHTPGINISTPGSSPFHTTTYRDLPNNEVAADITFNCPALREAFPKATLDTAMGDRHIARIDALERTGSVSAEHPVVQIRKDIPTLMAENIQDMYETLGIQSPALSQDRLNALVEKAMEASPISATLGKTPDEQRALDEANGRPYIRQLTLSCLGMS